MKKVAQSIFALFFITIFSSSDIALAGILAEKTRVIYAEKDKEQPLMLANTNPYPVLVQLWADDGRGDPNDTTAPFIVIPAIFRLEPGQKQGVRIIYNGTPLATDKETVNWLNIYEIPPSERGNDLNSRLAMTMNTQLKIFYRPDNVMNNSDPAQNVRFKIVTSGEESYIECENPTPYYLSLTNIVAFSELKKTDIKREPDMMTPPFSQRRYRLNDRLQRQEINKISVSYINDNGLIKNRIINFKK
ncbi:fimbrial biogenesis chaperone [Citrobacter amalonaticus]|uniref:fimbrial biogenesis chaperone n=1 Tax=Citrobacter amalonaticus TaxID=35703 RepID=UPI00255B103B|nr:molecular chaperone [Citrobacter amalonaticus]MDL4618041.1 molecular chaperone [Citrobacter amalonaticus]MDL4622139.1 molecular chaperone [Citrobacter amalonaticus]